MKKTLSLLLVLAMVLSSFSFAFATEAEKTPGEVLRDLGVLAGNAEGDLMLDKELSRQDMIVLLSRLLGAENEAKAFEGKTSFKDVKDPYYVPFMAWAEANELTKGVGEGLFGFGRPVTEKEVANFMLRALGYTDVKWEDVAAKAVELGLVAKDADLDVDCVRGIMAEITLKALNTKVKDSDKTLAEKLALEMPVYELAVKDVTVNTAKSFLVKFNKAVEDTSKIEFSVKRGGTEVKVTAKWNEAKTEATLEAASNLPTGDYTVVVTDKTAAEAKELASKELKVEKEKIVEVVFSSDMINRINDIEGVVTYRVKNQYGEDITNSGLARNISWIASTSKGVTPDYTNGILTIAHGDENTHGNQLVNLKNVIVTGNDRSTGFSVTKNFEVSTFVGSIGEIKINGLVDKDGKEVDFVADPTKAYYLDMEVYDNAGNRITSYKLLNADVNKNKGMYQPIITVYTSNPDVKVIVEEKDGKAQFRVNVSLQPGTTLDYDMPVVFTAISNYTGKSATLNTTLLKSRKLEKFILQYPSKEVAVGETVEIPYEAYDQNGNKLTRYEDINGKVMINVSNGAKNETKDSKGNYKLLVTFNAEGPSFISASVPTSTSFQQITLNVREAAVPVNIGNISFTDAFEVGATKKFGFDEDLHTIIPVKDKFDRDLSLYYKNVYGGKEYSVEAVAPAAGAFSVSGTATLKDAITVKAEKAGVSTITFNLMEKGNATPIASKSLTLVAVDRKDIVGLKAINYGDGYAVDKLLPVALQNGDIAYEYYGYVAYKGLLNNGGTVRLAPGTLAKATVNHPKLSMIDNNYVKAELGYDSTVKATVTGYIYGEGGMIAGSVEINPTNAVPVNEEVSVEYDYDAIKDGKVDTVIDQITLSVADINGKNVFLYNPSTGAEEKSAPFYFVVSNQYGDGGLVERVFVQNDKGTTGSLVIDNNGNVTSASAGTYFVTAITNNGLTKTVKVVIQ